MHIYITPTTGFHSDTEYIFKENDRSNVPQSLAVVVGLYPCYITNRANVNVARNGTK